MLAQWEFRRSLLHGKGLERAEKEMAHLGARVQELRRSSGAGIRVIEIVETHAEKPRLSNNK
jgi:hypothetical protein